MIGALCCEQDTEKFLRKLKARMDRWLSLFGFPYLAFLIWLSLFGFPYLAHLPSSCKQLWCVRRHCSSTAASWPLLRSGSEEESLCLPAATSDEVATEVMTCIKRVQGGHQACDRGSAVSGPQCQGGHLRW